MRTLLVIAEKSGFGAAVQALLDPAEYRLLIRSELDADVFVLNPALVDACLLDAELIDVAPLRLIKKLRQHFSNCRILIYTSDKQREWEEEAYLEGVSHVLTKPLRGALLHHLLDQLWAETPSHEVKSPGPVAATESPKLDFLGIFPRLFQHGFSAEALLHEVILIIREIFKVNRAAIFLRNGSSGGVVTYSSRASVGLSSVLLQHLDLPATQGIAQQVLKTGKIIRASQASALARKELEILGTQLVIPVSDREQIIGFALIDSHLNSTEISDEEAQALFQLLEGVGMALKSIAAHTTTASHETLFSDTLTQLSCGCVVVDEQMNVVHANPAAVGLFLVGLQRKQLAFRDLPQEIGSRIFTAAKTGTADTFPYETKDGSAEYLCRLNCFRNGGAKAILLVIDDVTHIEKVRQLEVETASLRLIKDMAVHLAHEIGNAIMPVVTSQQLKRGAERDAKMSRLDLAASNGLKRINRLTRQMQFLADDSIGTRVSVPIPDLLNEAIAEVQLHHEGGEIVVEKPNSASGGLETYAERPKMVHALAEVILNALQASPSGQPVRITWEVPRGQQGSNQICLIVNDGGSGFTVETARRAMEPFFSTRTVGMGLGLTVANRIIHAHGGRLELSPSGLETGIVRIFLQRTPPSENLEQQ